jgi:hypothetical protein
MFDLNSFDCWALSANHTKNRRLHLPKFGQRWHHHFEVSRCRWLPDPDHSGRSTRRAFSGFPCRVSTGVHDGWNLNDVRRTCGVGSVSQVLIARDHSTRRPHDAVNSPLEKVAHKGRSV